MIRLFVISLLFIVSCNQGRKFDKNSWQKTTDLGVHPEREKMLSDLTENHILKGLQYSELVSKLGEPDFWEPENKTIYYGLANNYGSDIDPTGQRALKFQFSSDSIITKFEIIESSQ